MVYKRTTRVVLGVLLLGAAGLSAQSSPDLPPVGGSSSSSPSSSSRSSASPLETYGRQRPSSSFEALPLSGDIPDDIQSKPTLSSDRIIAILEEHPDLLANAKRAIASRMSEEGGDASNLTDDEVFNLIDENADVRAALTQQLNAQGYLSAEDKEDIGQSPDASYSTSLRRGSTARLRLRPPVRREFTDPNAPRSVAQPDPYPDVPALHDLYAQARAQNQKLTRFGLDVFRNRGSLVDNRSLDMPVGADYVLGPGDRVALEISGGISQRITRTIDREGKILVPEAGALVVAGKTIADTQSFLRQALAPYYRDVVVDISLTRIRTVRVYVVGEVQRPGAYDVSSLSTPLNALYAAGGITSRGSMRSIRLLRGDKSLAEFDLYQFLMRGIRPPAERMEPGDVILVPPAGPEVTVEGMVRRPAIYELKGEKSIDDVVELAGGVLAAGALRQIRLERIEAHRSRVLFSVDLPDGNTTADVRESLQKLGVQDGDRVTVIPIAPYTSQTVYLEGHVSRPGKYPYKQGMDVGSLLHSYDDVLPEPSQRAEIIRLEPPDFRPKVMTFALSEVLDGSDPVELKPFDTIRVLGRYDDDAPKVSVVGEVMHPGEYPLSEGMTASMLLQMAGGFKRSAYTATADIASYVVQDGKHVEREHTTFEISKALAGERDADVLLKPGDVLSIRQLTGWGDIGAAVVLNGEVRYPGTYGINDGERLSSVLRRAGGLLSSAYPAGSRLERQEVRDVEEKSRMELIRQIENATPESKIKSASVGDATAAAQLMEQQKKQILTTLRDEKSTGRMVIKITADIDKWQNTEFDPELRAGDLVTIPKRPNFVVVTGQVYNPTAIGFSSGKSAEWYLRQAGGPTESANKKKIFVVRANGSVVAGGSGLWGDSVLDAHLEPGDTVIVPERIVGGSTFWKNLLSTAQIGSSIAVAARIATSF